MLEELRDRLPGDRSDERTPALRWLLPVLIAVPILLVLLRYRPVVTRAVAVLADHLSRAGSSLTPSSPIPSRPTAAVLADEPTSEIAESVEVAERVAARPVVDEDVDVMLAGAQVGGTDSDMDSVPGDGTVDCPADFPIKGNTTSKIYHLPGTSYYDKTRPGVCFRTAAAAEGAGYRASKASPVRAASMEDGL